MIKAKVRLRNPNQGSAHNPNHTWIVLSGPASTILYYFIRSKSVNTAFTFHRSLGSTYWGKGAYQVRQHNEIISDATPSAGTYPCEEGKVIHLPRKWKHRDIK